MLIEEKGLTGTSFWLPTAVHYVVSSFVHTAAELVDPATSTHVHVLRDGTLLGKYVTRRDVLSARLTRS